MTTYYGSLVGAVKQQSPVQPVDMAYENSTDRVVVRDTINLNAQPGDILQIATNVGWETVLDPAACELWTGALGGGATLSIGDVNYPSALLNGLNVSSAVSGKMLQGVPIGNYFQPLWQLLGYASLAAAQAFSLQCTLLATIGGGAASGTVTWQMKGSKRI